MLKFLQQVGIKLKLHTSIGDMLGSNLYWETGYPDWIFAFFPSVPPGKFRESTSFGPRLHPSKSYKIHHHPCIIIPTDAI
jgi:hypothetical protein